VTAEFRAGVLWSDPAGVLSGNADASTW